jgi:hypothetical protein
MTGVMGNDSANWLSSSANDELRQDMLYTLPGWAVALIVLGVLAFCFIAFLALRAKLYGPGSAFPTLRRREETEIVTYTKGAPSSRRRGGAPVNGVPKPRVPPARKEIDRSTLDREEKRDEFGQSAWEW